MASLPARLRRSVPIATLIALLIAVSPIAFSVASTRISVDTVAEGLTCQCGCGLTVANCNHPQCEFSVPVRTQIEAMIARGMTRSEILTTFRAKYGEKILSAPTTEGFNLLAWIMPFSAILTGGALLFAMLGRWRSAAKSPDASEARGGQLDAELRMKLEAEIKEDF
jgi:cytochrome c-type biogenesis protein CcmH